MPSKKQYNLVNDDAYDSRIPLYNEEAFQHGITFHAKYIGSLDVPRPSSRVEIVAAMRRIRYEFKAKSIKKRKVSLTVSVDGVKVIPRSKRRNNRWPWEENKFIILHHPIYRIFYVSHDSQDLKIFSYIARDGGTNAFKCNVFKSKKKSQAMRIVRTVGQAFEVCHKLSLALATSNSCEERHSLSGIEEVDTLNDQANKGGKTQGDGASEPNSCDTPEETVSSKPLHTSNQCLLQLTDKSPTRKSENEISKITTTNNNLQLQDSASIYHHIQLLKEQLEQQNQQMQSVVGQIQLLKDQLSAETNARIEAQAQNHHLHVHNKELLEHIKKLVNHIHSMEEKFYKRVKSDENPLLEPFHLSPPPAIDSSGVYNSRYVTAGDITTLTNAGQSLFDDQFSADPLTKMSLPNTFNRELSTPYASSNSPKLGVSFSNTGLSLPTSPSSVSFSPNLDVIFKPDSFVCSSPKQIRRTTRNLNPLSSDAVGNFLSPSNSIPHSPSFSQSSMSPGLKSKKHQVFSFDQDPAPYSSSNLFNFNSETVENNYKLNNNSRESTNHNSSYSDSFVAQVTRDLAKMSTADKSLSDNKPNPKLHSSSNFNLFKS